MKRRRRDAEPVADVTPPRVGRSHAEAAPEQPGAFCQRCAIEGQQLTKLGKRWLCPHCVRTYVGWAALLSKGKLPRKCR